MARADKFCRQGRRNRLCAWQVQEHHVFGHESRPDSHTALVRDIFHHSRKSHLSWPWCSHYTSFLLARTPHLSARSLSSLVRLPVCSCWRIPRSCESVWCLRGPLVRECPVRVCACLPCAVHWYDWQRHWQGSRRGLVGVRSGGTQPRVTRRCTTVLSGDSLHLDLKFGGPVT